MRSLGPSDTQSTAQATQLGGGGTWHVDFCPKPAAQVPLRCYPATGEAGASGQMEPDPAGGCPSAL